MKSFRFTVRLCVGVTALVLVLLCISLVVPRGIFRGEDPDTGSYRLASVKDGDVNYYEGPVYFEIAQQASRIQNKPVFKLHFIHPDMRSGNGFGFLIPLTTDDGDLHPERYRVLSAPQASGFSEESVFGYADVNNESASLFFTESGSISIHRTSVREVAGAMNMWLKNAQGQRMHLKGNFRARPLNDGTDAF